MEEKGILIVVFDEMFVNCDGFGKVLLRHCGATDGGIPFSVLMMGCRPEGHKFINFFVP